MSHSTQQRVITFVTTNHEKFNELKRLFPCLAHKDIDLPEIQHLESSEIVKHKLSSAAAMGFKDIIVEDTSLAFTCLGGMPGPFIKWFMKSLGNEGLVNLIDKQGGSRDAVAKSVLGYLDSKGECLFAEGAIAGEIVHPQGEGFGWDSIFKPTGSSKTFAEMSFDEKIQCSMRTMAATNLVALINPKS